MELSSALWGLASILSGIFAMASFCLIFAYPMLQDSYREWSWIRDGLVIFILLTLTGVLGWACWITSLLSEGYTIY